jgi:hypothetical protein
MRGGAYCGKVSKLSDQPDEDDLPHPGWRYGDERGGPSGPGGEPLVYERYGLDWDWKNYLGCLWLPGLLAILFVSQQLSQVGLSRTAVQLIALAAVFGLFLVFGLIDLSGRRWNWRKALIWLWLPGWIALMAVATLLQVNGAITIAAVVVLAGAFWLYSRSGRQLDD